MSVKDFKTRMKIKAEAQDIYAALTNPFTIELWSGYKAEMSTAPGSEFSLWDGDIAGKNLEFEENKKVVQQWYFGEQEEASIVTIKIFEETNRCQVELLHTNIPEADYNEISEGWTNYYLGAIKEFFEQN
ncbi:Activator of Hsp90 ATPase homolog 1-like protein [Saccharicrinis carchari]|uniref:Activator of Hsp90 ATPase homolog 1-like protein n=1 Tax=Saccharicrinis carchari TaxID=1168039 RepID=A0A521EP87_SACCC|nr:SRPBCC domain-containing protein [Saccharicrinis carchari]SMO85723.1 Activator of Hsp90 ATPase homolog 1-like protein [Saccharicrinis carchari]